MNPDESIQQRATKAAIRIRDRSDLQSVIAETLTAQRAEDAAAHAEEVARLTKERDVLKAEVSAQQSCMEVDRSLRAERDAALAKIKEMEGDLNLYSKALWKFGVTIVDVKQQLSMKGGDEPCDHSQTQEDASAPRHFDASDLQTTTARPTETVVSKAPPTSKPEAGPTPDSDMMQAALKDLRSTRFLQAMSFARTLERQRDEARARVKELEQRLEKSPYGDDKIDELESALNLLRAQHDSDAKEIAKLKAESAERMEMWQHWQTEAVKAQGELAEFKSIDWNLAVEVANRNADTATARARPFITKGEMK